MPLRPDTVGYECEPVLQSWDSTDCLLYALGIGAGVADPAGAELEFTTENSTGVTQLVYPTFPVLFRGSREALDHAGTFDRAMLVHGEQSVEIHRPLTTSGTASCLTRITGVYDKGSGGVIETVTDVTDAASGAELWSTTSSVFIRGEGGFGGDRGPSSKVEMPDREPDHVVRFQTRGDQALLYRLSGDRNPLHSDPSFAARGGFDRPILHGLCTYGFTGRALLQTVCDGDPDRFLRMSARFSKPVLPGESLTVSIWRVGDGEARMQTATDRGLVIDRGVLTFRPS